LRFRVFVESGDNEKRRQKEQRETHHHVNALLDGLLQDLLKGAERVLAADLVLLVDALFF
jgi:hypothetical protein